MWSIGAIGGIVGHYPEGQILFSPTLRGEQLGLTDCEICIIKEEGVHVKMHPGAIRDRDPIWRFLIFDHKVNRLVVVEVWTYALQICCRPVEGRNLGGVQPEKPHTDTILGRDIVFRTRPVELTVIVGRSLQDPRNIVGIWLHLVRDNFDPISSHSVICDFDNKKMIPWACPDFQMCRLRFGKNVNVLQV